MDRTDKRIGGCAKGQQVHSGYRDRQHSEVIVMLGNYTQGGTDGC